MNLSWGSVGAENIPLKILFQDQTTATNEELVNPKNIIDALENIVNDLEAENSRRLTDIRHFENGNWPYDQDDF